MVSHLSNFSLGPSLSNKAVQAAAAEAMAHWDATWRNQQNTGETKQRFVQRVFLKSPRQRLFFFFNMKDMKSGIK